MNRLLATIALFAVLMAPGFSRAATCYDTKSCKPDVHGTAAVPFTKWSDTYKLIDGKQWDLNGAVIEGFTATVSRSGILVERGQSNIIVRNGVLSHSATPNTGSALPVGLAVNDGHDVLFENMVVRGFQMAPVSGHYLNGDCSSGEVKSYNVTFRNTLVSDCSDGGYDFKTTNLRYEEATAQNVDYCFRVWGQATASNVYCKEWAHWSSGAAVQVVASTNGGFVIDNLDLEATPGKAQVVFDMRRAGATITVKHCSGNFPTAASKSKLVSFGDGATAANTHVTLDASCHLDLIRPAPPPVVTVPPPPPVVSKVQIHSDAILPNKGGGPTIVISSMAASLKVKKGTVLLAAPEPDPAGGWLYTVK